MYFYAEEGGMALLHRIWMHIVATWRILFSTEITYCGGDAVLCQITLTTCSLCRIPHSACSLDVTLHNYYKVIRGAAAPFGRCVIAQLRVN